MDQIKIMVAEDNPYYRQGLCAMLHTLKGVVVNGSAQDGVALLELLKEDPPHLVFTDIQMPQMNGVMLTRHITENFPGVRVLALTQFMEAELITEMLEAGARGYLEKSTNLAEVAAAINNVLGGYPYYCPKTSEKLLQVLTTQRKRTEMLLVAQTFTDIERRIIQLICEGYVTKQIAPEVFLSEASIEKYRSKILEKAGVRNMLGLIVFAVKAGLYQEKGSLNLNPGFSEPFL